MSDEQKLSEHELEVLRQFENARHLQDMTRSRGWQIFLELRDHRIAQLRDQFIRAKYVDKDALFAMQVRLQGIVEFSEIWVEGVMNAIECLEPDAMQQIIQRTKINPSELDGDLDVPPIQ